MKSLYILILFLMFSGAMTAQVGIGTTSPNAHAVLELKSLSNNQGLLMPRLTTVQRNAMSLSDADNGLMVYDSDDHKFYYWQSSQWLPIRSGSDGDEDPANEIQNLELTANTLTISNNPSATAIDLAPFFGTNTDEQTLSFNATTGNLAITGGNSVSVTAAGSAGGVLSGTYPSPGLATTSGNNILGVINNASTTDRLDVSRIAPSTVGAQVLTTVAGITVWAPLPGLSGGQDLAEVLKTGNDAQAQDAFNFKSIGINYGSKPGPGALNVNGSHYVSFTMISGTYTTQPEDYVLISDASKGSSEVILPPAAENRGRILVIRSTGTSESQGVLVRAADKIDGADSSELLHLNIDGGISDNIAYSITVISTGSTWLTMTRAVAREVK